MNLSKIITSFKLQACKTLALKARMGKTDIGIFKVAFMVAALDGEVTESEYAAFDAMVKKCRGYTAATAAKALDEAMRSAGYLMLLSKRVKTSKLVKAFIAEAAAALPKSFAYCPVQDIRRAVITWIAVGMSDGDYSERERACIEALRKHLAEQRVSRAAAREERWQSFSPSYRQSLVPSSADGVQFPSEDFVTRVEKLIAQFGDSDDAAKELRNLLDS